MRFRLRFEIAVFGAVFLVALAVLGYLFASGRMSAPGGELSAVPGSGRPGIVIDGKQPINYKKWTRLGK